MAPGEKGQERVNGCVGRWVERGRRGAVRRGAHVPVNSRWTAGAGAASRGAHPGRTGGSSGGCRRRWAWSGQKRRRDGCTELQGPAGAAGYGAICTTAGSGRWTPPNPFATACAQAHLHAWCGVAGKGTLQFRSGRTGGRATAQLGRRVRPQHDPRLTLLARRRLPGNHVAAKQGDLQRGMLTPQSRCRPTACCCAAHAPVCKAFMPSGCDNTKA